MAVKKVTSKETYLGINRFVAFRLSIQIFEFSLVQSQRSTQGELKSLTMIYKVSLSSVELQQTSIQPKIHSHKRTYFPTSSAFFHPPTHSHCQKQILHLFDTNQIRFTFFVGFPVQNDKIFTHHTKMFWLNNKLKE